MERIVDIYGHRAEFDCMYQIEDSWFGRVLMKQDNTFEGVVEDYYQDDMFYVCGKVSKDQLDVYKCARGEMQFPNHFEGKKEDGRFYGTVYVGNQFVEIPVAECKMTLLDSDKTREESDEEKQALREKTEKIKIQLGEYATELIQYVQSPKTEPKQEGK